MWMSVEERDLLARLQPHHHVLGGEGLRVAAPETPDAARAAGPNCDAHLGCFLECLADLVTVDRVDVF